MVVIEISSTSDIQYNPEFRDKKKKKNPRLEKSGFYL